MRAFFPPDYVLRSRTRPPKTRKTRTKIWKLKPLRSLACTAILRGRFTLILTRVVRRRVRKRTQMQVKHVKECLLRGSRLQGSHMNQKDVLHSRS
jgi:hypothetical protein